MTGFVAPLKILGPSDPTGDTQTNASGFVRATKVLTLGSGNSRQIVTLPPKSTLTALEAAIVSAPAADVSALVISWGNSGQASRYGLIAVSALGQVRGSVVSAATDFDTGGTIVVVASAVSTTTFVAGGARVFIQYVTVE